MFHKNLILLHLKSFLASPRKYLASWRNFVPRTDLQRWSNAQNLSTKWDERTVLVATMIPPNSSVLEFGAGNEYLKKCLPEGCIYQPSDIVARSENTLVCDLNAGFPILDKQWDIIVFSGVAEYIEDLQGLLTKIRSYCRICIFSYVPIDRLESMTTRMQNGWINHFSREEVEAIIHQANFLIQEHKVWNHQDIYSLR